MKQRLRLAADIATAVAAVAIVASLGWRAFAPPAGPTGSIFGQEAVGTSLAGATLGVDFTGRTTLLMVLASDCGFCQESMPFYRRLLARERDRVQVVVAAPARDAGIGEYLESENVTPDAQIFVEAGILPVAGTPTLLVVDSDGLVTHAWVGLLDADREADVLGVLFGAT